MNRTILSILAVALIVAASCQKKLSKTDLSVNMTEISFSVGQTSQEVEITSGSAWNAIIESSDPMLNHPNKWLVLTRNANQTGKSYLTVTCTANPSFGLRSETIKVSAQDAPEPIYIKVTQEGTDPGSNMTAFLSSRKLVATKMFEVNGDKSKVESEVIPLTFFGWGPDKDKKFNITFPATSDFNRAIMVYRMGCGPQGCSGYDHTTCISFKHNGEWYEISNCVTPFGNSFGPDFEKLYYFDVTEYLPMLQGNVEFKAYFNGFDSDPNKRHHTVKISFELYKGTRERNQVFTQKLYDSDVNGNSGYRQFLYGFPGKSIEEANRMSPRTVAIPANVKSLEMKVVISGHGHDAGHFPNRPGYIVNNAAEFDSNYYTVKINGTSCPEKGYIFAPCSSNYTQAGTAYFDRGNWCPGNPVRIDLWEFLNVKSGNVDIDIDFEEFISEYTSQSDGSAAYHVQVDLFGYDK